MRRVVTFARFVVLAGLVALALGGCGLIARDVGYAGRNPGYMRFRCSDEGGAYVTVQGNLAAMMYGSNNSATVTCKGTVTIEQGKGPAPADTPSAPPAGPPR